MSSQHPVVGIGKELAEPVDTDLDRQPVTAGVEHESTWFPWGLLADGGVDELSCVDGGG